MEELSNNNAEHHTRAEIMKSKITDKESMIEKKNVEVYPSTNNCNYLFITNGQNPVKIEDNQRRYHIALRVSNIHQQDHQYFDKLIKLIKQEKFHLRDYFQNYTVEKADMKVIDTEANRDLLLLNRTSTGSFVTDFIPKIINKFYKIKSKRLYDLYQSFLINTKETSKPLQYKYFIDYISNKTSLKLTLDYNRVKWFINETYADKTTEFDEDSYEISHYNFDEITIL